MVKLKLTLDGFIIRAKNIFYYCEFCVHVGKVHLAQGFGLGVKKRHSIEKLLFWLYVGVDHGFEWYIIYFIFLRKACQIIQKQ